MFDDDQLTNTAELRELQDSLSSVAVPERPRLEAITARGRAHRRHQLTRVTRLSVAGAAAATAAALGLSGALTPASRLGTIRTASFTLAHNTDGTAKLTLNPSELLNPAQLQSDLAKYGIAAKVTIGSYCTSDPEPAGFSQVVSGPGPGTWRKGSGQHPTMTIDPSALPAGTELTIGNFQLPTGEKQANMDLIDTSSNTCSSTPPTLGPDTPGFGFIYGGPGLPGS